MTVTLMVALILAPGARAAATEKVLYSFTGGSDGSTPYADLILDNSGNLYGTTFKGGVYGYGTVFELTPNPHGSWTESVLYSFTGGNDGANPEWGALAFDTANNLYGGTLGGGEYGGGNLFELSPNLDGTWAESVLHQFTDKSDGAYPHANPIFDAAGNLYDTVAAGGAYGCGTVFKMTPGSNNHWTYHVIHQFGGRPPACAPWVGFTPDAAGAYYATTRNAGKFCNPGSRDCGTVFQLTPTSGGGWTYKVIHLFSGGKGGADPSVGGLVFDGQGNLYGATEYQGAHGYGLVFKLAPGAGDKWTYQVLHQFKGLQDGGNSTGRMIFDAAGNLYGPARSGGAYGYGVVFKLTPNQNGTWTENAFYTFSGSDGANPAAALISDSAGNIYGITVAGGAYGAGTVYEITP